MSSPLNKFNVLIVDDVSSARKSLSIILRQLGIKNIVEARSSTEALDKLGKETFQLVISDWEMPDLDGLGLLNKVKENPNYKDLPFIMITSASEKERVIEAFHAGVTDYAIKPVSMDTISSKIVKALQA